ECDQTGLWVGGDPQASSRAPRRGERTVCQYPGRTRAIGALDRNAVYGGDRAGTREPAGIYSAGGRSAHQSGFRKLRTRLSREIPTILRTVRLTELLPPMDDRSKSHLLSVRNRAVGVPDHEKRRSRFLRG